MEKLQIESHCIIHDVYRICGMLWGLRQVKWLKKFIPGLRVVDSIEKLLKMYCDNESAVFYAHNNKSSGATKHIEIKFYVVKEQI